MDQCDWTVDDSFAGDVLVGHLWSYARLTRIEQNDRLDVSMFTIWNVQFQNGQRGDAWERTRIPAGNCSFDSTSFQHRTTFHVVNVSRVHHRLFDRAIDFTFLSPSFTVTSPRSWSRSYCTNSNWFTFAICLVHLCSDWIKSDPVLYTKLWRSCMKC